MVKYEYEIKYVGPKKHIIVYQVTDGVDVTIYTGAPTISGSDNILIDEAKLALVDNYPEISKTLVERGITPPPGPTQSVPEPVTVATQSSTEPIVANTDPIPQPVSKEETYQSTNSTSNQTHNFPGISNLFKPSIDMDSIKIDLSGTNESEKQYFVQGLGTHPFVWYNAYHISHGDISYLELYYDELLPKVKMTFNDTANIIKSEGFPLDDTKVKIFLNSRSKNLKSIYMEFKILDFKSLGASKYSLVGVISVNGLFTRKYLSYNQKTSNQALQEFCKTIGIGFNSNINETSDTMTWINPAKSGYEFMNDVILNSYIGDNSFITGYVDYYYNFNYIDIEKEILRDNSNDQMIETAGIDQSPLGSEASESILPLVISTDLSSQNSSTFISKFKVFNNSTSISLRKGYQQKIKFYDSTEKDYLVFKVDSITSKDNNSIILKAGPQDNDFFKENVSVLWAGKLDKSNAHKNYNYSISQNRQNIDDLLKITAELTLPNPNYNLYRFQKINIHFIQPTTTPSVQEIALPRLTGNWIITNIQFIYSGGKVKQVVTAVKRELGLTNKEQGSSSPSTVNNNSSQSIGTQNLNPTDGVNPTVSNQFITTQTATLPSAPTASITTG